MPKRRYINFTVGEEVPGYSSLSAEPRARESCGVQCARCVRFAGFFLLCSWATLQAVGPWILSIIEVGALLLLYVVAVPRPPPALQWDPTCSLLDVLVASGARAALISSTYAYGTGRYYLRPYLYTAYVLGSAGFVLAGAQATIFQYPVRWWPAAALLAAFTAFSWLHVLTARRVVLLARRRVLLGLSQAPAVPWGPREQAWLLQAYGPPAGPWPLVVPPDGTSRGGNSLQAPLLQQQGGGGGAGGGDVEAPAVGVSSGEVGAVVAELADEDSCFFNVMGLNIHYKQAWPTGSSPPAPATAVANLEAGQEEAAMLFSHGSGSFHSADSATDSMASARSSPVPSAGGAASTPASPLPPDAAPSPPPAVSAGGSTAAGEGTTTTSTTTPADAPAVEGATTTPCGTPGAPGCASAARATGILLVHGFGSGVFCWRHIMQPLADATGCRVVAFDRPGFGLSSRPHPGLADGAGGSHAGPHTSPHPSQPTGRASTSAAAPLGAAPLGRNSSSGISNGNGSSSNPYGVPFQAQLLLQLCRHLGLQQVLLVGHADGCLVAAAAAAVAGGGSAPFQAPQQQQMVAGWGRGGVAGAGRSSSGGGGSSVAVDLSRLDLSWMGSMSQAASPRTLAAALSPFLQHAPSGSSSSGYWSAPSPDPSGRTGSSTSTSEPAAYYSRRAQPARGPSSTSSSAAPPLAATQQPLAVPTGSSSLETLGSNHSGGLLGTVTPPNTPATPAPVELYQPSSAARAAPTAADTTATATTLDASPTAAEGLAAAAGGAGPAATHRGSSVAPEGSPAGSKRPRSPSRLSAAGYPDPPAAAAAAGQESAACGLCDGEAGLCASPSSTSAQPGGGGSSAVPGGSQAVSQPNQHPAAAWYPGCSHPPAPGTCVSHQQQQPVVVLGLALLHPALSGHLVPSYTRLLARSPVGRGMLRRLLAAEVGEVALQRGWYNKETLSAATLELYKRPLQVPGWDTAVLACSAAAAELTPAGVLAGYLAVQHLPLLLLTGDHDPVATPSKVLSLAAAMSSRCVSVALLPSCGHVAQEEEPQGLLQQLELFGQQVVGYTVEQP